MPAGRQKYLEQLLRPGAAEIPRTEASIAVHDLQRSEHADRQACIGTVTLLLHG
jgi:hypothetical protein